MGQCRSSVHSSNAVGKRHPTKVVCSRQQVKSHQLKCLMLNARSLRSKFDEFKCYISLNVPDIVCVTESWVSEVFNGDRLQDFELGGYDMYSYCRDNRMGGGVILYVNTLLSSVKVDDPSKVRSVESLWIDVKAKTSGKDRFRIGAFYRAGNLDRESQNETDQHICDEIRRNMCSHCIIMGDFNLRGFADLSREDGQSKLFREVLEEELFLHQFVSEPTRGSSILDLVFSDSQDLISNVTTCEGLSTSDHNIVRFDIKLDNRPNNNLLRVPNFNRANFEQIRQELAAVDWENTFAELDTFESWESFKSVLGKIQSKYIPLKHRRKRVVNKPVWLTSDVREAIHSKHVAFVTLKESPTDAKHAAYKKVRNVVKKKVRAARRHKEIDLAENCHKDSKKFFSFYKFNTNAKKVGPLKVNGTIVSDESDMVEALNDSFKSVFTIEEGCNLSSLENQAHRTALGMGEIGGVDKLDVLAKLKLIKPNKAEGPDEIYARVLRECEKELCGPLAIIFNKSLTEAKIPLDWKSANVVPIFKKGDRSEVQNYRPVSLTSLVCKLLESILKDKIMDHLIEKQLITESQHGFRKGRSCLTNLLAFLDVATESFDTGKQLDIAYLDFSKAFDKVPHKRLGVQLRNHGIEGGVLNWVLEWLSGRQQRVILNGFKSGWQKVLSGVPQGSVLGPLLFIIFVNRIEDGLDSQVLKFADDIKIFRNIESENDRITLQNDLNNLVKWAETWQMSFNVSKCKVMHAGRVRVRESYEMDSVTLSDIEKEKDLGVVINGKLSVSEQVVESRNKAIRMLGVINRNVAYKNEKVIPKLYCAFVRPHLEYCVQAWSPTYEKDSWLLERVQKRATKMISGFSSLSYEQRLERLGMFSLRYRRLRGDLIEVYKFIQGRGDGYLANMFEISSVNRGRGHQYKLVMNQSRTRLRQSFFSRRVIDPWNRLPQEVVTATTLNQFKNRLDNHFKELGLAFTYDWR